ncbi:MAG TPA: hypothetical protein VFX96_00440 [Pyrinomonadaceae bacterium]|nr:hypothetical protein [Pyrinomonadaceae bacterium]
MRRYLADALLCALLLLAAACPLRAQQPAQGGAEGGEKTKAVERAKAAEALKKYEGRYELEVGLIPVSTLDVTLEAGELWMKPTGVKKRRLLRRSAHAFTDETEGTPIRFGRDEDGRVVSLTFLYEGASFTARRVELPPPSTRGNTVFRLKGHPAARVVALAGTFNNWNQSELLFAREGDEWVCRIDLDPGVYTYKFIVDGNWLLDPSNPSTTEDEAGNVNNVLEVTPAPTP